MPFSKDHLCGICRYLLARTVAVGQGRSDAVFGTIAGDFETGNGDWEAGVVERREDGERRERGGKDEGGRKEDEEGGDQG